MDVDQGQRATPARHTPVPQQHTCDTPQINDAAHLRHPSDQ